MIKSIRDTKDLKESEYDRLKEFHRPFEIRYAKLSWQMDHLKALSRPDMVQWLETEWKLRKHEFEHGLQKHVSEILLYKGKEQPPDPIYLFNIAGSFLTEKLFLYKTGLTMAKNMDFMQPFIMRKRF